MDLLTLRPFRPEDAGALVAVLSDPEVMRFSLIGAQPPETVPDWIAAQAGAPRGWGRQAAIWRGAAVGYGALYQDPARIGPGEAEIGLRLSRAVWGRGLGARLAAILKVRAFALGARRAVALVDPGNAASLAACRRAGFRDAGTALLPGYEYPDLRLVAAIDSAPAAPHR